MLARLIPFVPKTTRISAVDFLNPIQDEVIALYAGTKSLVSLLIDGAGDNASAVAAGFASILKGIIVPGGTDADVALDVQAAPTTWRVIVKAKAGTSTYARLGVTTTGAILTINANYDVANSRWQRDASGYAMALYLDTSSGGPQLLWYDASSTSNWTSWSMGFRQTLTLAAGNLVAAVGNLIATAGYAELGATISSGTVGAGQALTLGRAYKDTLPVASAYVTNNGAAAALAWGFNIASVNRSLAGYVEVVLTNAPTNIVVTPTLRGVATGYATADWNAGAKKITVATFIPNGTATDFDFNLVVFGG